MKILIAEIQEPGYDVPEFVKFVQSQPFLIQSQEGDGSKINKIDLACNIFENLNFFRTNW